MLNNAMSMYSIRTLLRRTLP